MPRLVNESITRNYSFDTFDMTVTRDKGRLDILGLRKNLRTGTVMADTLFSGEDELAALADDLSEALDIVRTKKGETE